MVNLMLGHAKLFSSPRVSKTLARADGVDRAIDPRSGSPFFFFFFFFSIIILMLIMSNKVYTNSIKLIQACNLLRYIKLNK